MSLPPIDYERPRCLHDAFSLLEEMGIPMAGGTDVIIQLRESYLKGDFSPRLVVDLKGLDELSGIEDQGEHILIGAITRLSDLIESDLIFNHAPSISEAASRMGSIQIRNKGTIGGNICNAAPCADSLPPLLIHDAVLILASKEGTREVDLENFLRGPGRTDRKPGEILVGVKVKKRDEGGEFFIKLARRDALNKARMNFAAWLNLRDGKIIDACFAAGAIAPHPIRVKEVEELLLGEEPSEALFARAGRIVRDKMLQITGRRWSTPYKSPVVENLTARVLSEAARRAR